MKTKNNIKKIFLIIIGLSIVLGCAADWKKDDFVQTHKDFYGNLDTATASTQKAHKDIAIATTQGSSDAQEIKNNNGKIASTLSKQNYVTVQPFVENSNKRADSIIGYFMSIDASNKKLDDANKELLIVKDQSAKMNDDYKKAVADKDAATKAAQTAITDKNTALKKLSDLKIVVKEQKTKDDIEREKQLHQKLTYLILACVIGAGICAALWVQGNLWAMGVGIACITTLIVAITVDKYSDYIGYAGAGLGVILAVAVAWTAWRRSTALKEVVKTVEATKDSMTDEQLKDTFGNGATPGVAHILQSDATHKIVDNIRKDMKFAWEPTISK